MESKIINDFLLNIKKYQSNGYDIYIYGAGRGGKILSRFLSENNINFLKYCVTDIANNEENVEGHTVIQFDKLKYDSEKSLFINSVCERGNQIIESYLRESGVIYYLKMPIDVYYSDSEEKKRKKNPTMEITPYIGCSVNCRYCPQNVLLNVYFQNNKFRSNRITFSQYQKLLNKIPKNTLIEWAGFVEPFLNKEASDMMVYTHEQGYTQTLFTTLVGMTDEDFEKIKSIPFQTVCLHTPDDKNYAHISMTEQYWRLLNKMIDNKRNDGTDFITSANCQNYPHPDVLKVTKGKLKIYCELSDRAGLIGDKQISHYNKKGKIWCERAVNLNHNVLLPDGSVVICCNDFGMKHILGNLFEQSYEEILCGEIMQRLKRELLHESEKSDEIICRKCIYAVECNNNV